MIRQPIPSPACLLAVTVPRGVAIASPDGKAFIQLAVAYRDAIEETGTRAVLALLPHGASIDVRALPGPLGPMVRSRIRGQR